MQAASLFAGIGGFDLAAERLGIKVVLQAEIDPSAQRVLSSRFHDAELVGDARTADLRGVDIVFAGFPCQGLSAAASTLKHGGLIDPESKSYVVWAALGRVYKARPRYIVLENADSLRTRRYAEDMRALIASLEANGYTAHVFALNAGCYGSLMRRTRTFVLARRGGDWTRPVTGGSVSWVCRADAIGVNNQQGGASFCSQPSVTRTAGTYTLMVTPSSVRTIQPEGVERLFGYPEGWTTAAGSTSARYERLGNTVSIHAARAAIELLLTGEAPLRRPADSYYDTIYPFTVPAGGGAAGSAFGRLSRTLGGGRTSPNTNQIELAYCVPVYEAWMRQLSDEVSPAMWHYLDELRRRGLVPAPRPWPEQVKVEMTQR